MAVKIIISRKILKELEEVVAPFLNQLFLLASRQNGYLFGETLYCKDDPEDRLTIGSWRSLKDWEAFLELEESKDLHSKVDLILGRESTHRVYFKKALEQSQALESIA